MDDLQLGLALIPVVHDTPVVKVVTFDLNHDHRELQLAVGSEPWNYDASLESQKCAKNKRNFEVAFGNTRGQISCTINKKDQDQEENHVVGWPPIKPRVKKQLHQNQGGQIKINDQTAKRSTGTGPNSLYVKVKMEGVPIARKIDLRLYHSYQMLTDSLITMFANYQQTEKDHGASYTLTYQDKDGDWLLAGDVPWQSFMESVQRLEIIRNDDG